MFKNPFFSAMNKPLQRVTGTFQLYLLNMYRLLSPIIHPNVNTVARLQIGDLIFGAIVPKLQFEVTVRFQHTH